MIMAILRGTPGDDELVGDINGVPESDTISGLAGGDLLVALFGDDRLFGGVGDDRVDGGSNNDRVDGGAGDDIVLGGNDNDSLFGRDGDDFVRGEAGRDALTGNAGADSFFLGEDLDEDGSVGYESGVGKGNRDRIIDFNRADGDKIDVSNIDADLTAVGLQDFGFVGEEVPGTGELGFLESAGSTIVRGNTDDDAAADFEIQLDGAGLDLVAGDFIL
jgi:Ca2+-binding RTX toxin-like protein